MQRRKTSIWSAAPQPLSSRTADVRVNFYTHMVSYQRTHGDVVSTLEMTVPAGGCGGDAPPRTAQRRRARRGACA